MAAVRLEGIVKRFGTAEVLRGIDLAIAEGEFVVFVGPSGCGKSTLLRTIAGLEEPSAGRVLIGDTDVTHAAPAERGIAMVFQSYALYPQMSVAENMGFALKLAGLPRAEIATRVERAAATLGITELLERRPRELSGGQRQRVAIGRAIVREPKVFLFDEPLSNLDAALRHRMRYEFAGLHRTLGATMIYVTHDQVEAMTLADRIVVLNGGIVEQVGAPMELYEHPASRFVAGFIGAPGMNFIEGVLERVEGARATVAVTGDARIEVACDASGLAIGMSVAVGMRPEDMRLTEGEGIAGTVRFVELLGGGGFAYIDVPGQAEALTCAVDMAEAPVAGTRVRLTADPERLHLFDGEGRALPRTVARTPRAAA